MELSTDPGHGYVARPLHLTGAAKNTIRDAVFFDLTLFCGWQMISLESREVTVETADGFRMGRRQSGVE